MEVISSTACVQHGAFLPLISNEQPAEWSRVRADAANRYSYNSQDHLRHASENPSSMLICTYISCHNLVKATNMKPIAGIGLAGWLASQGIIQHKLPRGRCRGLAC